MRPLFAAILVLLAACNRPTTERFASITHGMTKDEVLAILGKPSSTQELAESIAAQAGYVDRWHYGDNLSSLATNAVSPDVADDRVFAVFFNAEGYVVRTRAPAPMEWREAR